MRFLETPVFTSVICGFLDDEANRALQIALLLRPEQGRLISGSGGLRKIRWPGTGRGKRRGIRVIYYWYPRDRTLYMLFAYAKNEQGDLTPIQIRMLGQLVREEFR
jgi:hypothetical protein